MKIEGATYVHGPHALQAPHRSGGARGPQAAPQPIDQLDISREAQELSQARQSAPIRQDLVDRVRAEIAAGVYDTEEKFDLALDRLAAELNLD